MGAIRPAMMVTMMGKSMRVVRETDSFAYGILIIRSFLVVTILMALAVLFLMWWAWGGDWSSLSLLDL